MSESPITFKQLQTLQDIDITTTIQDQLDSISAGSLLLPQGKILVGDVLGHAAAQTMSGDATIAVNGTLTVANASVIAKVLTAYSAGAGTVTSSDSILTAIQKVDANSSNATVIARLLTGYSAGAGTVAATDSILSAIQKVDGNSSNATVIARTLTSFVAGAGTVSSADTILGAIQKLTGNTQNLTVLANLLTGFSSAAGTVASTDTVLVAFNKLDGNVNAIKHVVTNTQTDSYTLVLADDGKMIIMNKGSANDLTIPANATVAFPTGTQIIVQQLGAGQTTIVATGGVTLQSALGLLISAQYGLATLIKTGTDTWAVAGALTT